MLIKEGDLYKLTSFEEFKDLICTFTTTHLNDLRQKHSQKKLSEYCGFDIGRLVKANQVHSGEVKIVRSISETGGGYDGIVTSKKNIILMILVADCLPIVAFDPKKKVIGIAHAGWRGTTKNIAGNLIGAFRQFGSSTKNILVGFGPCIEFCHYEIGKDVAEEFENIGLEKAVLKSVSGRTFLDLKKANTDQLVKEGIFKTNIDMSVRACTFESSDFYSYRKDQTNKRFAAIIGLR